MTYSVILFCHSLLSVSLSVPNYSTGYGAPFPRRYSSGSRCCWLAPAHTMLCRNATQCCTTYRPMRRDSSSSKLEAAEYSTMDRAAVWARNNNMAWAVDTFWVVAAWTAAPASMDIARTGSDYSQDPTRHTRRRRVRDYST